MLFNYLTDRTGSASADRPNRLKMELWFPPRVSIWSTGGASVRDNLRDRSAKLTAPTVWMPWPDAFLRRSCGNACINFNIPAIIIVGTANFSAFGSWSWIEDRYVEVWRVNTGPNWIRLTTYSNITYKVTKPRASLVWLFWNESRDNNSQGGCWQHPCDGIVCHVWLQDLPPNEETERLQRRRCHNSISQHISSETYITYIQLFSKGFIPFWR